MNKIIIEQLEKKKNLHIDEHYEFLTVRSIANVLTTILTTITSIKIALDI